MRPLIHHTFGPHIDGAFLRRSLALLVQPWKWRTGSDSEALRRDLQNRFHADVALFASGREGLLALLRAMKIRSGEEIIVQGYTCVVVPNAVAAAGAVPVYVDIDPDTLNLTVETVRAAITPRTRAVICQHTFGIPAPVQQLRTLCDERKIVLIEDCAHIIADLNGPSEVGQLGDAVLLSFGRDKAISGIAGGAMVCRNPHISAALHEQELRAVTLPLFDTFRLLLYPLIYAKAHLLWGVGLGKLTLKIAQVLHLFVPITSEHEKKGKMSPIVHAIPNACASLARAELHRLEHTNNHRRVLVAFYLAACAEHGWPVLHAINAQLPLQKFPLFFESASAIRALLKKHDAYLDDGWTGCVICPTSVDPTDAQYAHGCDPHAEKAGMSILSLPTHPTMSEANAEALVAELAQALGAQSHLA